VKAGEYEDLPEITRPAVSAARRRVLIPTIR